MEKQIGPWSHNLQNIPPTSIYRHDFNKIPLQFRRSLKLQSKNNDSDRQILERLKVSSKQKRKYLRKERSHNKSDFSIPKIETPRKQDFQKSKVNSYVIKEGEREKYGIKKRFKPKQFYLELINFRRRYTRQATPEPKMGPATDYKNFRKSGIKQFNLFK